MINWQTWHCGSHLYLSQRGRFHGKWGLRTDVEPVHGAAQAAETSADSRLGSIRIPPPAAAAGWRARTAAAPESAGGKPSRGLTFQTPTGDCDRSCGVLDGTSWEVKRVTRSLICGAAAAGLLEIIFLSSFKAASHLPAMKRREERGSTADGCTQI